MFSLKRTNNIRQWKVDKPNKPTNKTETEQTESTNIYLDEQNAGYSGSSIELQEH